MNSSRRQFLAARSAVREAKGYGADFVKVYSRLDPTAYRAVLDEARRQGLRVHGHGPDQVSIRQLSAMGQRSIEHVPALRKYLSADALWAFGYAVEQLYKPNRTAEEIARQRHMWAYRQRFVGELFAHGVPVLAGTDTGTPYSVPGFSLHQELELLVGAGATPRQALYAATVEPARFLGLGDDLGSVTPRKIADLVVLYADPLTDIRNTRRIHSVVIRGRVISPQARLRMLADVEAAVKEPPAAAAIPAGGCCGTRPPGQ